MNTNDKIIQFNRSKIYEDLDYQPEPTEYNSNVPWTVQQQIAATNGRHFIDRTGKLIDYPVYKLPVKMVQGKKIMLDIGCGWGRWLVAGCNAGYIPIGLDIRLEFCKTNRRVLFDQKKQGYSIVADLENIPFRENVFDLVWSFSVIQHTHVERLKNCIQHINRILANDGFTYLEFPNSKGIRNRFGVVQDSAGKDDYNSWNVRYYSPKEYEIMFNEFLSHFSYANHSFLGIGILPEDLKYVSLKNKIICTMSLVGSFFADIIPGLKNFSDSIYIRASKKEAYDSAESNEALLNFLRLHNENPTDNLNVVSLLQCPLTSQPLSLSDGKNKLINQQEGFFYPIVDNIPIMISDERQGL